LESEHSLFTRSASFFSNDAHVLNGLVLKKLTTIFLVFLVTQTAQATRSNISMIVSLRRALGPFLDVTYYDAESASVWG
jgi:hypothetical protein